MSEAIALLKLSGRLRADEVARLEHTHAARFRSGSLPGAISLAAVEEADSSALALLLEWQAQARARGQALRFEEPPESLRVIARLTGVAPLLGWPESEPQDHPQ